MCMLAVLVQAHASGSSCRAGGRARALRQARSLVTSCDPSGHRNACAGPPSPSCQHAYTCGRHCVSMPH